MWGTGHVTLNKANDSLGHVLQAGKTPSLGQWEAQGGKEMLARAVLTTRWLGPRLPGTLGLSFHAHLRSVTSPGGPALWVFPLWGGQSLRSCVILECASSHIKSHDSQSGAPAPAASASPGKLLVIKEMFTCGGLGKSSWLMHELT